MKISILGTRGIPAAHGGFETFSEYLAVYLINRGWDVTVYCQTNNRRDSGLDEWNGIRRVTIYSPGDGALSTVIFDLKVAWLARKNKGVQLLLGYNTALFNIIQRIYRQPLLINMDGIEWRREKWGVIAKTWFWLNEKVGSYIGSHLIADHPMIKKHLERNVSRNKITMIPYGASDINGVDESILEKYGLESGRFSLIVARPEPENSILEMVKGFSGKHRNHKLVVLGSYSDTDNYQMKVKSAASNEVVFLGAIYDQEKVNALRYHARLYLHGHKVGGTNPSLVEAMGAGSAILAHDNHFNRWVAGTGGKYFCDIQTCSLHLDNLLDNDPEVEDLKVNSKSRFHESFTWNSVLAQYEELLLKHLKEEF
jgi:glycosyltransferase involved in cell wall biosynthesis